MGALRFDPTASLSVQRGQLLSLLEINPLLSRALEVLEALDLPDWHLGAGAWFQNVWNAQHGFEQNRHLEDLDVIYHDPDLSEAAESRAIERATEALSWAGLEIDVKNQARVHLWYEARFGRPCPAYPDATRSILTWPIIASCVAVTRRAGALRVCSPHGFGDMFAMRLRHNDLLASREVAAAKAARWSRQWPMLQVGACLGGPSKAGSP